MNGKDRREYFRTRDCLRIEFRRIGVQEFEDLKALITYGDVEPMRRYRGGEADRQSGPGRTEERILGLLTVIDHKLSIIMHALEGEGKVVDSYHIETVEAEISGSGVAFVSGIAFVKDEYLDVFISLPMSAAHKIRALCRVVHSDPTGSGESWKSALEFAAISSTKRDDLVRYVFEKERRAIRMRKEAERS